MADYSKLNRHSETWCPIPFVGLALHPMGFLTRCMMSEEMMSNAQDLTGIVRFQDLVKACWMENGTNPVW